MRVLLVNDDAPGTGGGAGVHLARLADGLTEAGDVVDLFAGRVAHHGARKTLDLWDPFARRALAGIAGRFRPDVVHYHNVLRELSVSVLGVPGAASVMTVHDAQIVGIIDASGRGPNRSRDPLRRLKLVKARFDRGIAVRRVDRFIAVASHMAARLRAAGITNVDLVPSFAPAGAPPADPPSRASDVFFAGRLVPEKGVFVLLDAFERVAATHPDARLVIAGSGPDEERVRRSAEGYGGQVTVVGHLDQSRLRDAMEAARVVVAPAIGLESGPLVVVEAAMAGRPVVVSDDPGLRELVDESGCGIVVPRGDVAALARAIEELLDDRARADAMGASGRAHAVATRSLEAAITKTREVYARALDGRRSAVGRQADRDV